ncbi:Putative zinc metalloprotease [Anaerohalosphaera lusitana]|uniref:Zinc metalloprotease n=1 Tax=Anaerohalosphaera lusitana TaxID=1936003 RepID=A0A1U9NQE0_9BACT|nr:site-2 protease family protein [Anaerohalosphaera lusitana]AQT70129.1 Putative zinc metalloprotease [Anaerohalosphaera lusitana]
MFGRKIRLFTLMGFKVGIDLTWFILAILITWSLAEGLFPYLYEDLSTRAYWWMGVAGALGLFVSIVFHEFCHSIVARRYGLPMKGITLFIFGGVAEMDEEPPSPKAEFMMAIFGPISSIFLGVVLVGIAFVGESLNWILPVTGVIEYLAWLNFILAIFNLIPAFPLDGGRVLRSILWHYKHDLRKATKTAANFGSAFGTVLIILGVIVFIGGNFIGGIWYFLIGMFIKNASRMSYQHVLVRKTLSGEPISRFMNTEPVTVPADDTVQDVIEKYFYKYHYKMFPVMRGEDLVGCITSRKIKELSSKDRQTSKVGDLAISCSEENTIGPETDSMDALSLMNKTGNSRLLVVEDDRLKGILTLKDLLEFLALKVDLEEDENLKITPESAGIKK